MKKTIKWVEKTGIQHCAVGEKYLVCFEDDTKEFVWEEFLLPLLEKPITEEDWLDLVLDTDTLKGKVLDNYNFDK